MSKRNEVYQYIRDYIIENTRSPSLDEISDGCGLSGRPHAKHFVDTLVELHLLERSEGNRGLSLPNSRLIVED